MSRFFLDEISRRLKRRIDGLTDQAETRLQTYDWPGNVRELRNLLERAVLLAPDTARWIDLPGDGRPGPYAVAVDSDEGADVMAAWAELPLKDAISAFERWMIERHLRVARGNHRLAADGLGLPRRTLSEKIRRLGIAAGAAD